MTLQAIGSDELIEYYGAHDRAPEGSEQDYLVQVTAVTYHVGEVTATSEAGAKAKALDYYRAGWLGDQMIEDMEPELLARPTVAAEAGAGA